MCAATAYRLPVLWPSHNPVLIPFSSTTHRSDVVPDYPPSVVPTLPSSMLSSTARQPTALPCARCRRPRESLALQTDPGAPSALGSDARSRRAAVRSSRHGGAAVPPATRWQ
eukprot:scaffold4850_cov136-Isochrysis_galbana.AAC.3